MSTVIYDSAYDAIFCVCKCKDCKDEDYPLHCWNKQDGCSWQGVDTLD